jgi:hypothetical protein
VGVETEIIWAMELASVVSSKYSVIIHVIHLYYLGMYINPAFFEQQQQGHNNNNN